MTTHPTFEPHMVAIEEWTNYYIVTEAYFIDTCKGTRVSCNPYAILRRLPIEIEISLQ